jgi:hypothetical protein
MRARSALFGIAGIAALATGLTARTAHADDAADRARIALAEAKAAISAEPPNRAAARAALLRATAAKDDPVVQGDAFLGLARMDRDERAYASALANDRACVAAAPNTVWAQRATQQIAWLSARSEDAFAPLDRFERVKLDPSKMSDPAAIDDLARDADAFPPGLVRVEARRFVAEAWLASPRRTSDAIRELRKVQTDLPFAELLTDRTVERELVDALLANGEVDGAASEVAAHRDLLDPPVVLQVQRLARRLALQRAARVELFIFSAIALLALLWRRRTNALPKETASRPSRSGTTIALVLGIGLSAASAAFLALSVTESPFLDRLGL